MDHNTLIISLIEGFKTNFIVFLAIHVLSTLINTKTYIIFQEICIYSHIDKEEPQMQPVFEAKLAS